jgi:hypothetical protein
MYDSQPGDFEKSKFVDGVLEVLIKNGKLLDLATLPEWLPPPIKKLIRQSTKPLSHERIQTAADLCTKLHKLFPRMPNWIDENDQITVEYKKKKCRAVRKDNGDWIVEKKVPSGWMRVRNLKQKTRTEAIVNLQNYMNIEK